MRSDDGVPEERCGFVLEPGDVPEDAQMARIRWIPMREVQDYEAGSDQWYVDTEAACCWREVWNDADDGRCIWHAAVEDKPADALIQARADEPERLDGAYVPAVKLDDAIDFEDCRLWVATFDGTLMRGASFAQIRGAFAQFPDAHLLEAQFPDANLRLAQFPDANLPFAQFPDADLVGAQFSDANLVRAQFSDADLHNAQFPDAELHDAQFPDADLRGAQFPDGNLSFAQFYDANLPGTQFPDANLSSAQFPDANLAGAQFPDADLGNADLSDTDAANATFTRALLEGATLANADLGDADLTNARLHDAHLLNVRINERTTFGDVAPDEARATRLTPAGVRPYVHHAAGTAAALARQLDYTPRRAPATDPPRRSLRSRLASLPGLRRLQATLRPKAEATRRWWFWYRTDREALALPHADLGQANTVYRTIQRLYRENSMPRRIDRYYVRARDTRRKQAIMEGSLLRWLYLATQRWVMGYGERPWRVVATSGAVIVGSALAYQLVGPIDRPPTPDGTTRVGGDLLSTLPGSLPGWLAEPLTSLYFSVVTFTTLGYGDLQPATGIAQAIATVESLVGAFLLALLVYVLGRRATR